MRKAHAEHNEELCALLLHDGRFNDWVVTTAFYSAVNFVKHQIFPFTDNTITFNDFDHYFSINRAKKKKRTTLHRSLILLTHQQLPKCGNHYRWLHDQCQNARYNNYIVSDPIAKEAKKKLDHIKKNCNKP